MAQSDEQREQYVRALERERRSVHADRDAIDAELERLGAKASVKRAERRPRTGKNVQTREG